MNCITELQLSHHRLCELYNNLYCNQRLIVSHDFGSGHDLSISSLLKFAPIAENFQSYADDYKKELLVFQNLLNTLQQTVRKRAKVAIATATAKASAASTKVTAISNVGQLNGSRAVSSQQQQAQRNNNNNNINPITTATATVTVTDDDHKSNLNASFPSYPKYTQHRKNAPNINLRRAPQEEQQQQQQQQQQYHGGDYAPVDITQYHDDVTQYQHEVKMHANINDQKKKKEEEFEEEENKKRRKRTKAKKRTKAAPKNEAQPKKLNEEQLVRTQMDELIDFEIEDNQAIHEEDEQYQQQRNAMQERDEAKRATMELLGKSVAENIEAQQIEVPSISYLELIAPSAAKKIYKYRDTFDVFQGNEIYTSTMLRFSGLYGLRQDNESDMNRVKNLMISYMRFEEAQIENIQIRDGRSWCIVYVRCAMKFVKDRIKSNVQKNKQIAKHNRERVNKGEEKHAIYRLNEYQRRRNINLQTFQPQNAESNKLYILNFDVLNKKCHKALTNMFLKFGDLADDVQIGINSRNDPFAKVLYKNIQDAKRLWTYQNFNADRKHKKISFGQRELTIQYAKY